MKSSKGNTPEWLEAQLAVLRRHSGNVWRAMDRVRGQVPPSLVAAIEADLDPLPREAGAPSVCPKCGHQET